MLVIQFVIERDGGILRRLRKLAGRKRACASFSQYFLEPSLL